MATTWMVNRAFPRDTLIAIDKAIKASETTHRGEIRFAVEGALDIAPLLRGQTARERAIDVFSQLRIWDTERNNGVLIYLLLVGPGRGDRRRPRDRREGGPAGMGEDLPQNGSRVSTGGF